MGGLQAQAEPLPLLDQVPNAHVLLALPHHHEWRQEVVDLISRCMALEPSERPTAQQLMQRLAELQKPDGTGSLTPGASFAAAHASP